MSNSGLDRHFGYTFIDIFLKSIYIFSRATFHGIVNQFLDDHACIKVTSEDELLSAIELLIGDIKAAEQFVLRAKEVVARNKGSTEIQASYIIKQLAGENS